MLSDESVPYYLYGVVECQNEIISLSEPFNNTTIERKTLGFIAVGTDIFVMTCFLFGIWVITYLVKLDSERHKNLLFETKEFSVVVDNLPTLSEDYTIE